MTDDQLSSITKSSSGISDCDVTILSDDSLSSFVQIVEDELKKKFSVADVVPAGRLRDDNILSRIKHAKVIVVILTKNTAKKCQACLASFFQRSLSHRMNNKTTLVLYEKEVKNLRPCFQNSIQLLFRKDPNKIAALIGGLVVALETVSDEFNDDFESKEKRLRKYFGEMLIHSILNPLKTYIPYSNTLDNVKSYFKERYGLFEKLFSVDLEQYLTQSQGFILEENTVKQTSDGAMECYTWFYKCNNHQVKIAESEAQLSKSSPLHETATDRSMCSKGIAEQWLFENHNNTDDGMEPKIHDWEWKALEPLQKLLYEFDSRYSFFLISGKDTPLDTFSGIANVPWLKVYDFETKSRSSGLLSTVESLLIDSRSFSISTSAQEATKPLSNTSTDWYFPLGSTDVAGTEYEGSALNWFKDNKQSLELQFSAIADFCSIRTVPVFLILWYDEDEKNMKFLNWILSVLDPAFNCETLPKKIVLCTNEKLSSLSSMQQLVETYELSSCSVCIPPETLYKWLASKKVPEHATSNVLRLPKKSLNQTKNEIEIVEISKERLWVKENIEVLSLESQDQISQRKTEDFGKDFLKGGLISWDELASKDLAIERESKKRMWKCLESDVLKKQKSVKIRILHAPGGGGTTFARQLLWNLHTKVPCGVVVPTSGLWVNQIAERVRFLHDQTHLPIVLLIEGRSEHEINQLYESCAYAIVIVHVQRCSHVIPTNDFIPVSRICYLPGKVTPTEADSLTTVFSLFSPQSANALKLLTRDVKNKKEKFMFEYGLTAFDQEFKGVRKYVQGYLKLHDQEEGLENLQDWQKVVSYLSLALYYGQSGLDCGIFHHLLKKSNPKMPFVSLTDVEYSGRQFIIETDRKWKISYNMVAKEILEQVLSRSTNPNSSSNASLNMVAKRNLHELVKSFIEMIQEVCNGGTPENVVPLLVNMIIRRNNSEVEMSDSIRKRCVLSKLLDDIPDNENRVEILRLLTQAFPRNSEFLAHLGRLLNMYKRFEEAEACLHKAVSIRKEELKFQRIQSKSPDNMLGRIHHIFGLGYTLRAKQELKKAIKASSSVNKYQNLLHFVIKAVEQFFLVRQNATHSFSYGFLGEVHVRLLVAEYVERKFPDGCVAAFDGSLGRNHLELSQFVCESHSVCDQLLAECLQKTSSQELQRVEDYTKCVDNFTRLYSKVKQDMSLWKANNLNLHLRRSHIACLKMAYKADSGQPCIENVSKKDDLRMIVKLHETTFRKVFSVDDRKISITVDALEWLEAIRHRLSNDNYSLVKVFETVLKWEQRNESIYATFYAYAINFLLAVFSPGENLNKEYYNKAKIYKENMQSQKYKHDSPFWRLEWIANHSKVTIKKLINSKKLGQWDKDKRFWRNENDVTKLQVFTGTVIQSYPPLRGIILLDVAQSNFKCRIEIYFVPKLYDLDKSMYAEQKLRVEFCIGLSLKHGAEAFLIKPLKTKHCDFCGMKTEEITINTTSGECSKCFRSFL